MIELKSLKTGLAATLASLALIATPAAASPAD